MRNALALFPLAVLAALTLLPEAVLGQAAGEPNALASQNLRGYTHMFVAYAIAWGILVGWVVSIARRLGRLEKALKE